MCPDVPADAPLLTLERKIMEIKSADGFSFVRFGEEPYTRKDGVQTVLALWRANCKECGSAFTVKTPVSVDSYWDSKSFLLRHCDEHKLARNRNDMTAFKSSLASFVPG
jgi:hypothetical protein